MSQLRKTNYIVRLDLKIIYLVNFNLNEKKGLGLITKRKVEALRKIVENVDVISSTASNAYLKVLIGFYLDLKTVFYLIFKKPDYLISRGPVGFLSQITAKIVGVRTVREVHAYAVQEVKLLKYKGFNYFLLKVMAWFSHFLDVKADLRIFNHPDLLKFYRDKDYARESDVYVYNGYSEANRSLLSKKEACEKFNLAQNKKYLVFVGSATKWHGVEYLISLQREFIKNNDDIQIVCGGASIKSFDPDKLCLNISPLNAKDCSDLIKVADLCLLPVINNRVSPGSPLKLYDYIVNQKVIVAQEHMFGYSDEVLNNRVGFCVDFSNPKKTREQIVNFLSKSCSEEVYCLPPVSWEDRMQSWVSAMLSIKQSYK